MNLVARLTIAILIALFCLESTSFADGQWITSNEGVKLWNPVPQPNETCTWTGLKDREGFATGKGLVIWYVNAKVAQVSQATFERGQWNGTHITLNASGTASASSDSGDQYEVTLIRKSSNQQTASRPTTNVTRAQSPPTGTSAQEIKESLDAIKSGVELVNEVRKGIPSKLAADLIVKSVSVAETKKDGSPWDAGGGKPELKVIIDKGVFGASLNTGAGSNSTFESFNNKKLRVAEGDTIKIKVYDQDAFDDDLAGSYEKKITAETLRQGRITWSFDQVTALVIEFEL